MRVLNSLGDSCLLDSLVCQSGHNLSIAVFLLHLATMEQQAACLTAAVAAASKVVARQSAEGFLTCDF